MEHDFEKEIEYYNALPFKFDNFIFPCEDIPLNDGVVYISHINTDIGSPDKQTVPTYHFTISTCIDNSEIGSMNLHIGYNSSIYFTGHIGCRIKEEHRRKGFAYPPIKGS